MLRTKSITLLNPATWDDKNDAYYMAEYKRLKDAATVLAFALQKATRSITTGGFSLTVAMAFALSSIHQPDASERSDCSKWYRGRTPAVDRATVRQIARPKRCHSGRGGRSHAGHRAACLAASAPWQPCPCRKSNPDILMMQSTEDGPAWMRPAAWTGRRCGVSLPAKDACALRYSSPCKQQHMSQVMLAEHNHMVEAFPADRADQALSIAVLPG